MSIALNLKHREVILEIIEIILHKNKDLFITGDDFLKLLDFSSASVIELCKKSFEASKNSKDLVNAGELK